MIFHDTLIYIGTCAKHATMFHDFSQRIPHRLGKFQFHVCDIYLARAAGPGPVFSVKVYEVSIRKWLKSIDIVGICVEYLW